MGYGWTILVILITLGALLYLDVFSFPTQENECILKSPFVCNDVKALSNSNSIIFEISTGYVSGSPNFKARVESVAFSCISNPKLARSIVSEVTCDAKTIDSNTGLINYLYEFNQNEKITGEIEILYTTIGGLPKEVKGAFSVISE